ncbi:lipid-transfer protein [Striga asiatica]|uniref:Lipid-transfer protein n=1 Tax=Striga asiatica TaxID=4170 RepID=A0A5A7RIE9_STRAF|nr:lipid-transfer protein [Striga asiatica]
MAKSFLVIIFLLLKLVAMNNVCGVPSAAQCQKERDAGYKACKWTIISGWPPSGECCKRVRVTHTECVCPLITPKVAFLINVKRTIQHIEKCGRKVPSRFKCGSITTP